MSRVIITPSALRGTLRLPPSKSDAHRAVICAGLAEGISHISPVSLSDDIAATCDCMRALGTRITRNGDILTVEGRGGITPEHAVMDCRESGSTLRFLLPVAASGGINSLFTGAGRLPDRPIKDYLDLLAAHGAQYGSPALPLTLSGRLKPGVYELPGNVSSQMISGLMFALPMLGGDSEIRLINPLESAGYVNMTAAALRSFGIRIHAAKNGYFIPGGQRYIPRDYKVEADWSQAAFFYCAAALSGDITLTGLNPESVQGDRLVNSLFRDFGAALSENSGFRIKSAPLSGITVDASQIPDMVPALAVTAAFADGVTRIHSAGRLRLKESDRIAAVCAGLRALGVKTEETADSITVYGGVNPAGDAVIDGCGDHRIVMAFSAAACGLSVPITITDAESVNKSYPGFFDDFKKLGGNCHVINDR